MFACVSSCAHSCISRGFSVEGVGKMFAYVCSCLHIYVYQWWPEILIDRRQKLYASQQSSHCLKGASAETTVSSEPGGIRQRIYIFNASMLFSSALSQVPEAYYAIDKTDKITTKFTLSHRLCLQKLVDL